MPSVRETSVGEFLAWCVSEREKALETISDFDKGMRWHRGVPGHELVDVTDKHRRHYEGIVERMDALVVKCGVILDA
jgi:hypothetical protein